MELSCLEVSQHLLSLRAHLRVLQKELENCTDNCVELEQEIQQTSKQIVAAEQQQSACELMLGSWNINANGFTGTLTPVTTSVFPDEGRLSFDAWIVIEGNDFTFGNYYYGTGQIVFTREIVVSENLTVSQDYTGSLFANPTGSAPATFAGTFTSSDSPNSTFGWIMSK